jgi:hypothetical protein
LPKESEVGEKVTAGAVPVPVRATVCGLPVALSATESVALRAPAAWGENVTLIVQVVPGARLVPQLFVCKKSPLFIPVTIIDVTVSVVVPMLVRIAVCTALRVPTAWLAKRRLLGVSAAATLSAAVKLAFWFEFKAPNETLVGVNP